ncbi:apolipoprotein A-IV a isoform X1 [Mastacembelus armatus]|uniref:apolipoprotein A-IV a isoform X1 n=2 Tax=Mastacembelus armatus TaxID=205130 RepID=UPI000E45D126|nr:apolipoprotein A-IV-like isoform X1 [Mastacembelus armatus]XP_033181347.1 apolipoprotein A-IV-like isoform X1 [Mastacembelus armatus]
MCPAGHLEKDFNLQYSYKNSERCFSSTSLQTKSEEHSSCLCKPTDSNSTMKGLVILVLAVFSVCNANILWPEPPKSNMDMVKDAFWDYVAKMTLTAEDSLNQIRMSELGQEVNARISQSVDTVNQYIVTLRSQVAPLTQNFMTQFTQEAEQLKARLEKDLTAVSTNLQPYAEQMVERLHMQVEELKKEANSYAEAMDPEALKTVLLQKSQELRGQLDKSVDELQTQMIPYTEEIRQKMEQSLEEFQRSMIPLAQSFETQLIQKSQEIQQNLAPYGEELKAKLDASTQDLQAQLAVLWESFTKRTQ